MRNLHDLAQGWFRKAASNLTTAQVMLESAGLYDYDLGCFLDQETAAAAMAMAEQVREGVFAAVGDTL